MTTTTSPSSNDASALMGGVDVLRGSFGSLAEVVKESAAQLSKLATAADAKSDAPKGKAEKSETTPKAITLEDVLKKFDPVRDAARVRDESFKLVADNAQTLGLSDDEQKRMRTGISAEYVREIQRAITAKAENDKLLKDLKLDPEKVANGDIKKEEIEAAVKALDSFKKGLESAGAAVPMLFGKKIGDAFSKVAPMIAGSNPNSGIGQIAGAFQKGMAHKAGSKESQEAFEAIKGLPNQIGYKMGQAFKGAQIGAEIGVAVTGALGIKGSKTGAMIGGAIGNFIPIPGAAAVLGTIGSIAGGLLKKTKKASATVGGVDGGGAVTGTTGNDKGFIASSNKMADGALASLDKIITALGGGIRHLLWLDRDAQEELRRRSDGAGAHQGRGRSQVRQ